ncbi:hypothetical protein ARMGADRAFT_1009035 [Armillaria gallica]|uniref:Uncharacterized protein n=1 Tax=Armillaria gallica TaxID=47427 RepID=A0A2H3EDZ8_ARMGA|nr:hypothetical protein ARMGADRAFT_1009035 [Armillaria gallica]
MCEPVDTRLTVVARRHYPEDPSYQLIAEEDVGPVSVNNDATISTTELPSLPHIRRHPERFAVTLLTHDTRHE